MSSFNACPGRVTKDPDTPSASKPLPIGGAIGVALGGAFIFVALLAYCWYRNRKQSEKRVPTIPISPSSNPSNPSLMSAHRPSEIALIEHQKSPRSGEGLISGRGHPSSNGGGGASPVTPITPDQPAPTAATAAAGTGQTTAPTTDGAAVVTIAVGARSETDAAAASAGGGGAVNTTAPAPAPAPVSAPAPSNEPAASTAVGGSGGAASTLSIATNTSLLERSRNSTPHAPKLAPLAAGQAAGKERSRSGSGAPGGPDPAHFQTRRPSTDINSSPEAKGRQLTNNFTPSNSDSPHNTPPK